MKLLVLLFLAIMTLVHAPQAGASHVNLGDEICVLRGAEDQTAQQVLKRKGDFDCSKNALLAEGNDIWIYLDIEHAISGFSDPAIVLHMSYHGAITIAPVFNDIPVSRRFDARDLVLKQRVPDLMVFPIETGLEKPTAVLVRIEGAWDLTNWKTINISSMEAIEGEHLRGVLIYALLSGLLITPLIFSALVYFALRIDFLPYHFGMIAFALVYALSWSGLIFALPIEITPIYRSNLNHISIAFAFFFACLLTRSLCDKEAVGRLWNRLLPAAGFVPVVATFLIMLAAPNFSHVGSIVLHAVFILPLVAIIGALVTGALKGHLISRLQLLAWSPMIIYVLMRILKGLAIADFTWITQYGLYPSLISEALLTTCVIAFRVYTIRKAHETSLREQVVLRNLASTDALTGAFNRRAFIDLFDQTLAADPGRKVLTLVLIDIDHFKHVNDTFGHSVGDKVLKEVVSVLQSHCRGNDMLARFGGEEFSLFLSTPSRAVADACAERIRKAVEAHTFREGCEVTISIGMIEIEPQAAVSFDQWYSAADRALYAAKTKGRNRVQRSNWSPASIIPIEDVSYAAGWIPKKA